MNAAILYVGSYTEMVEGTFGGHGDGIACFVFDAITADLKLIDQRFQVNPSYLSIAKMDSNNRAASVLFTVSELLASKNPTVNSYLINDNHSLSLLDTKQVEGGCPCHINYFTTAQGDQFIATACYETGNVVIYNIDLLNFDLANKNSNSNADPLIIQHTGSSQHPSRQTSAHAHCVYFDKHTNHLLVADLGLDQIIVYSIQKNNTGFDAIKNQTIQLPLGSGPRHICFDEKGSFGFIINELTGSVTIIQYCIDDSVNKDIQSSKRKGSYEVKGTFSVNDNLIDPLLDPLMEPVTLNTDLGAAAIRVSADGKFIYTSMRGDNTICLFAFDALLEKLDYIDAYPTNGLTPRDFTIDPSGKWLLVAHQDSDTITIFNVNSYNGTLSLFKTVENIKSPVCLTWLPK